MNNNKENNFQNKKASNNITYILLPLLALTGVIMLFTLNAKKINTGSSILDIFGNNNTENIKKNENNNKINLNKKEEVEKKEETAITEKEFKEKKAKNKDIVIIDLRTPEEINTGKISKEALEINIYEKDFKDRLNKLDKNKEYFVYCAHGNRSRTAKEIMKKLGFKNVYDLKGGIVTWNSELYRAVKNKNIDKKKTKKKVVEKKIVSKSIHKKEAKDFKGKVTFIAITSTACPHCRNEIPNIEKNIYKKYGNKINFYVNVVNGGRWRQSIPQGYNPNLQYKYITGRQCGFVPSWVILNKDGGVVKSVCGGGIKSALPILRNLVK